MAWGSKGRNNHGQMPEINLVPMMDLVLTILTFFIIASIVMSGAGDSSSSVDLTLPNAKSNGVNEKAEKEKQPDPLIVSVDAQNALFIGDKKIEITQLDAEVKGYLAKNPKDGVVVLKADSKLPYSRIIEVLSQMRAIGGEKVSLAVSKG
jgi:biopolymer transport protein ExbD